MGRILVLDCFDVVRGPAHSVRFINLRCALCGSGRLADVDSFPAVK
jgi:hypothetical protein